MQRHELNLLLVYQYIVRSSLFINNLHGNCAVSFQLEVFLQPTILTPVRANKDKSWYPNDTLTDAEMISMSFNSIN